MSLHVRGNSGPGYIAPQAQGASPLVPSDTQAAPQTAQAGQAAPAEVVSGAPALAAMNKAGLPLSGDMIVAALDKLVLPGDSISSNARVFYQAMVSEFA
jgi:hypothetical protein